MFVIVIKNNLRMHAIRTLTPSADLGIIKLLKIFVNVHKSYMQPASSCLGAFASAVLFTCRTLILGMHRLVPSSSAGFCANVPLPMRLSLTILLNNKSSTSYPSHSHPPSYRATFPALSFSRALYHQVTYCLYFTCLFVCQLSPFIVW